jgi:CheY-like chemotaxis protein
MIRSPPELAGKRVLIVEDELLVALLIEDFLEDFGCTAVGPCGSVAKALDMIERETLDMAVLDVNLSGEMVYPVADMLEARHIPFLFLSGYGDEVLQPGRPGWRVCAKPFTGNDLADMMAEALATPAA